MQEQYVPREWGRTSAWFTCVRSEATLWTRDRDFERIREVLPGLELQPSYMARIPVGSPMVGRGLREPTDTTPDITGLQAKPRSFPGVQAAIVVTSSARRDRPLRCSSRFTT